MTVPELGTIKAAHPPIVIVTSNRTREIHDALKRRCLYHWVDYPDAARELAILRAKAPGAPERLTREIVAFVQRLRKSDLFKVPGVAETIDWATALTELDAVGLDPQAVTDTLGRALEVSGRHRQVAGRGSQGDPRRGEGATLTWPMRWQKILRISAGRSGGRACRSGPNGAGRDPGR